MTQTNIASTAIAPPRSPECLARLTAEREELLIAKAEQLRESGKLQPEFYGGKLTSRLEAWFGLGVRLAPVAGACEVYHADPIKPNGLVAELIRLYHPRANSAQLLYYAEGASLSEHRDRAVFDPAVVNLNLSLGDRDLFGHKPKTLMQWGGNDYLMGSGEIWRFAANVRHAIPRVKVPRYCLGLRIIKQGEG